MNMIVINATKFLGLNISVINISPLPAWLD